MSNPLCVTWEWTDGRDHVRTSWLHGGWPINPQRPDGRRETCRSVAARQTEGLAPCTKPADWKAERRSGGRTETAWYCTQDLPSTEAPPAGAEASVL